MNFIKKGRTGILKALLFISLASCKNETVFQEKVNKIKYDTARKSVVYSYSGSIQEINDKSGDTLFLGGRYRFDNDGNLLSYSFQCDNICASYIVDFSGNGQIQEIQGKPIVYSFTSADEAKDSMYVKRYVSTLSHNDVQVEIAGSDKIFKKVPLKDEPTLSFIKSFDTLLNVKNSNRFLILTKFSGKRIDNDSLQIFYDTLDLKRKSPL